MGNKCPSRESSFFSCCGTSKKSHHRTASGDVLPADLHASSGQRVGTGSSATSAPSPRPVSLEVHPISNEENSTKFPAFPLHGVQKSSPSLASGHRTPIGDGTPGVIDMKKIELLFESYRDSSSDEDSILPDGVERFCLDLEVDPTEFIVLALAWKFKAETMCKFTRKEFVEGFLNLQCDSVDSLRSSFKRIESDAMSNFKDLYRYTFQFALDAEQGQRSLPCDIATAMWNVVFSKDSPALLQAWISFLEDNSVRGISKDTWNMFLYLTESLKDDFSNYNDTEAWPSLFDDFVDYQRDVLEKKKRAAIEEDSQAVSSNHALEDEIQSPPPSETSPAEINSHEDVPQEFESKPEEGALKPRLPGAISSSEDSLEQPKGDHRLYSNDAEIGDHVVEDEDMKEEHSKESLDHLHSKAENLENPE